MEHNNECNQWYNSIVIDVLFVLTANDNCNINVILTDPAFGSQFKIRDIGGFINTNKVILGSFQGNQYNATGSTTTFTFTCNSTAITSYNFVYNGSNSANGVFYLM